MLWCVDTITFITAKQGVCEMAFRQAWTEADHVAHHRKMVVGCGWVCLPKLHVAYLTGFAKISGLYISDLKIKDLSIP